LFVCLLSSFLSPSIPKLSGNLIISGTKFTCGPIFLPAIPFSKSIFFIFHRL
jgi:hypothetical protein